MAKPKVAFNRVVYLDYVRDYKMRDELPVHALMNYALNAGSLRESQPKVFTKDEDITIYYKNLFKATMLIYGVDGYAALRQWPEVDRILALENLPAITETNIRNGGIISHKLASYDDGTDFDEEDFKPKGYTKGGIILP